MKRRKKITQRQQMQQLLLCLVKSSPSTVSLRFFSLSEVGPFCRCRPTDGRRLVFLFVSATTYNNSIFSYRRDWKWQVPILYTFICVYFYFLIGRPLVIIFYYCFFPPSILLFSIYIIGVFSTSFSLCFYLFPSYFVSSGFASYLVRYPAALYTYRFVLYVAKYLNKSPCTERERENENLYRSLKVRFFISSVCYFFSRFDLSAPNEEETKLQPRMLNCEDELQRTVA